MSNSDLPKPERNGRSNIASGLPETSGIRLLEKLADGFRGAVYRAERSLEGDIVAVKVFRLEEVGEHFFRGLTARVEAAFRLEHPAIVPVYGTLKGVKESGELYLLMACMPFPTLEKLLADSGNLEFTVTARIIRDAAEALAYAAARGITHGCLHPGEIFFDAHPPAGESQQEKGKDPRRFSPVTVNGLGWAGSVPKPGPDTPSKPWLYASLPALKGLEMSENRLRVKADIFSLGAIFHHAIAGHPPLNGDTMERLEAQHRILYRFPLPDSVRGNCPPGVEALIRRMLAFSAENPDFQPINTYEELLGAIDEINETGHPPGVSPPKDAGEDKEVGESVEPMELRRSSDKTPADAETVPADKEFLRREAVRERFSKLAARKGEGQAESGGAAGDLRPGRRRINWNLVDAALPAAALIVLLGIVIGAGLVYSALRRAAAVSIPTSDNEKVRALRPPGTEMEQTPTGGRKTFSGNTPTPGTNIYSATGTEKLSGEFLAVLEDLLADPTNLSATQLDAVEAGLRKLHESSPAAELAKRAGTGLEKAVAERLRRKVSPPGAPADTVSETLPAALADRELLDTVFAAQLARARGLAGDRRYGDALDTLDNLPAPLNEIDFYRRAAKKEIASLRDQARRDFDFTMEKVRKLQLAAVTPVSNNKLVDKCYREIIAKFGIPEYVKRAQARREKINIEEKEYLRHVEEERKLAQTRLNTLKLVDILKKTDLLASEFHYDEAIEALADFEAMVEHKGLKLQAHNAARLVEIEQDFFRRADEKIKSRGGAVQLVDPKGSFGSERVVGIGPDGVEISIKTEDSKTGAVSELSAQRPWSQFNLEMRYKLFDMLHDEKNPWDNVGLALFCRHRGMEKEARKHLLEAKIQQGPEGKVDVEKIEKMIAELDRLVSLVAVDGRKAGKPPEK